MRGCEDAFSRLFNQLSGVLEVIVLVGSAGDGDGAGLCFFGSTFGWERGGLGRL